MSKITTHPLTLFGGLFVFCLLILIGMNEFLINRDTSGHKLKPLNIRKRPSLEMQEAMDAITELNWQKDPAKQKQFHESLQRHIENQNNECDQTCDDLKPLTPLGDLK